jgi:hypothetical protein
LIALSIPISALLLRERERWWETAYSNLGFDIRDRFKRFTFFSTERRRQRTGISTRKRPLKKKKNIFEIFAIDGNVCAQTQKRLTIDY